MAIACRVGVYLGKTMQQWHESNGIPRLESFWDEQEVVEESNKQISIYKLKEFDRGFEDANKLGIIVVPSFSPTPLTQKYYCMGWIQGWIKLIFDFKLTMAKHLMSLIISQENKPCAFALARNPFNKCPGWIIREHRFTGAAVNLVVYLVRARNGECFWTPFVYDIDRFPGHEDFDWSQIEKVKDLPIDYSPSLDDWLYDEF